MFGLGWMEISLLLILVLIFGVGPSSQVLGRLFGTYRKVNEAKRSLKGSFNPLNYLSPKQSSKHENNPSDQTD
jgi:hypothetical protein